MILSCMPCQRCKYPRSTHVVGVSEIDCTRTVFVCDVCYDKYHKNEQFSKDITVEWKRRLTDPPQLWVELYGKLNEARSILTILNTEETTEMINTIDSYIDHIRNQVDV